jgi:hypothetical protein
MNEEVFLKQMLIATGISWRLEDTIAKHCYDSLESLHNLQLIEDHFKISLELDPSITVQDIYNKVKA